MPLQPLLLSSISNPWIFQRKITSFHLPYPSQGAPFPAAMAPYSAHPPPHTHIHTHTHTHTHTHFQGAPFPATMAPYSAHPHNTHTHTQWHLLLTCFPKIRCLPILCFVAQSCPILCDPMDYNLPGSSVHGILQARILKWVAMPSSRESSQPSDRTQVSRIAGRFFTSWTTREALSQWVSQVSALKNLSQKFRDNTLHPQVRSKYILCFSPVGPSDSKVS